MVGLYDHIDKRISEGCGERPELSDLAPEGVRW